LVGTQQDLLTVHTFSNHMRKRDIAFEERFIHLYHELYQFILQDFKEREGTDLKLYKDYEPEHLRRFIQGFKDKPEIMDQLSALTSGLITLQALPNANHRTAFMFLRVYLKKRDIYIKRYDEDKKNYDNFYSRSKKIIERDIDHNLLFKKDFVDAQHSIGIEEHFKISKVLLQNVVELPQSGIVTVESLHSFIASMNQAGSLPSSNQ
jgi:prophage maintenance system killer protein